MQRWYTSPGDSWSTVCLYYLDACILILVLMHEVWRMNSRLFLSRIPILIGLIFVLAACNQAPLSSALPTPTKAPLFLSPTMTATPLVSASTTLGQLPQDCPPGPIQQDISSSFGPAVGADPIWVGAGNFRKQPPLQYICDIHESSHHTTHYSHTHNTHYL